ncbi:MAG: arsenate reductase ArsC [Candidatus Neomarinimicrobiota bacterium]|nr:MAG: arsenate reductase ArsC [Candidatus Neomarinimicrobiota bacterium]
MNKKKLLVLCTGNSCRSQMAEGWFRYLRGNEFETWSAGIESHGLNSRAVKVMAEAGVDISGYRSKLTDELKSIDFDVVITVCDSARKNCPYFPGNVKRIHQSFDEPPYITKGWTDEESILDVYRRVRDEIRKFVETFNLKKSKHLYV